MGPNRSVAACRAVPRQSFDTSLDSNPPNQPRSVATDQLEALGRSTYAARTFLALVSHSGGTAQEVSDTVTIPRARVYDAVEELQRQGLVDVQQSTPQRF